METKYRKMGRKTISIDQFMKNIYADSKGKHDYNVKTSQLKMDIKGKLTTKPLIDTEGFTLEFDDLGFNQICTKLDVPDLYKYGGKLLEMGQTARLASLFNFHVNESKDKDFWIRSKNNVCRAVMSDKYGIYDNDFIADTIFENFKDKNVDIVGFSVNNLYMNCRIRLLDNVLNAGVKRGKDDPLFMAIHVTNSEVGFSGVNISLIIYRLVCTNGLIREESKSLYTQKHVGGNNHEDLELVSEKLKYALDIAQSKGKGILEEFAEMQEEVIEMPMENIRYLSRNQGYSQKFTESVEQNYLEEKDNTRYGLINAFTAASRELEDDRRLDIEKFAGKLMYQNLLR